MTQLKLLLTAALVATLGDWFALALHHHDEHNILNCNVAVPKEVFQSKSAVDDVDESVSARVRRSLPSQQAIRIRTVKDDAFNALSNAAQLDTALQQAVTYFSQALQIRLPATTSLFATSPCLSGTTCSDCERNCTAPVTCAAVYQIPQEYVKPCSVCATNGTVTATIGNGTGVSNTDHLIFVTTGYSIGCDGSDYVGFSTCMTDLYNRPRISVLNFCTIDIKLDVQTWRSQIMHAMTHLLGFSTSFFPFYVDDNGSPLTPVDAATGLPPTDLAGNYLWSSNITVSSSISWLTATGYVQVSKTYLKTPAVLAAIRNYFNCSTLLGAELEDQGGPAVAGNHWEKRIFVNELMSGSYTETSYLSIISLAALQDSGWYYAIFSMGEAFIWGQGLGCEYATQSCLSWINSQTQLGLNPFPFCNTFDRWSNSETRSTCDPGARSVRYCNLATYTGTPTYQYFSSYIANAPSATPNTYGGANSLADVCPYQKEVVYENSGTYYYSSCSNPNSNLPYEFNYALQTFGAQSMCLRQSSVTFIYQCNRYAWPVTWGAGCYVVNCTSSAVTVNVYGQTYNCTQEGQVIDWGPIYVDPLTLSSFPYTATLVTGSIVCPQCATACPNSFCPMQTTPSTSATLLNTNQDSSSSVYMPVVSRIPENRPCNVSTTTPPPTLLPMTTSFSLPNVLRGCNCSAIATCDSTNGLLNCSCPANSRKSTSRCTMVNPRVYGVPCCETDG